VITGATSVEQIQETVKAAGVVLDPGTVERIDGVLAS